MDSVYTVKFESGIQEINLYIPTSIPPKFSYACLGGDFE